MELFFGRKLLSGKICKCEILCFRDWGRGMATAGRRTTNTIVSETHFGSIPGVEVGTMWRYRIQVAESGIHRPHVAGIAGRKDVGAFSIVLAGGYEDDKDDGDEVSHFHGLKFLL